MARQHQDKITSNKLYLVIKSSNQNPKTPSKVDILNLNDSSPNFLDMIIHRNLNDKLIIFQI